MQIFNKPDNIRGNGAKKGPSWKSGGLNPPETEERKQPEWHS